jgi:membrane protease YdiL (CAAX protease family)
MTAQIVSVLLAIELIAGAVVVALSLLSSYAGLALGGLFLLAPVFVIGRKTPGETGWLSALRGLAAFDALLLVAHLAVLIHLSLLTPRPQAIASVDSGAPPGIQAPAAQDGAPVGETVSAAPRPRRVVDLARSQTRPLLVGFVFVLALAAWGGRRIGLRVPLGLLVTFLCSIALVLAVRGLLERATGAPWWGSRLAGMVAGLTVLFVGGSLLRAPDGVALDRTRRVLAWAVTALVGLTVRAWFLAATIAELARYAGLDWSGEGGLFNWLLQGGHPAMIAASVAVVVVAGPAAEELLFRGALHPWLRQLLPAPAAIGVGAVAFALMHWDRGAFMLFSLAVGCVLGWARERTGRLLVPTLLHMSINAVAFLPVLLARP